MDFTYLSSNLLKKQTGVVTKSIDVTLANSYKGDMEGLLTKGLSIPYQHVQHNITLNGFNSSTDYNGETEILLLDSGVITTYL